MSKLSLTNLNDVYGFTALKCASRSEGTEDVELDVDSEVVVEVEEEEPLLTEVWSLSDSDSDELSASGKAGEKPFGSTCGSDVSLTFVHVCSTPALVMILCCGIRNH